MTTATWTRCWPPYMTPGSSIGTRQQAVQPSRFRHGRGTSESTTKRRNPHLNRLRVNVGPNLKQRRVKLGALWITHPVQRRPQEQEQEQEQIGELHPRSKTARRMVRNSWMTETEQEAHTARYATRWRWCREHGHPLPRR